MKFRLEDSMCTFSSFVSAIPGVRLLSSRLHSGYPRKKKVFDLFPSSCFPFCFEHNLPRISFALESAIFGCHRDTDLSLFLPGALCHRRFWRLQLWSRPLFQTAFSSLKFFVARHLFPA